MPDLWFVRSVHSRRLQTQHRKAPTGGRYLAPSPEPGSSVVAEITRTRGCAAVNASLDDADVLFVIAKGTDPMAWAGAEFAKYAPEERVMLETLIGAITPTRAGELSDDELYTIWAVSMSTPGTATSPSPRTR